MDNHNEQLAVYDEATYQVLVRLKRVLSEGLTINQKMKPERYIYASELPKFLTLLQGSEAVEEFDFMKLDNKVIWVELGYSGEEIKPILGNSCTTEQWQDFYLQMIRCVCIYFASFKNEVPTIEIPNENLLNLNVSDLIL
jgi:hypothetical protein